MAGAVTWYFVLRNTSTAWLPDWAEELVNDLGARRPGIPCSLNASAWMPSIVTNCCSPQRDNVVSACCRDLTVEQCAADVTESCLLKLRDRRPQKRHISGLFVVKKHRVTCVCRHRCYCSCSRIAVLFEHVAWLCLVARTCCVYVAVSSRIIKSVLF